MFVPFESLTPEARVWLYQTTEPIGSNHELLAGFLTSFTESWKSHGVPLAASFRILHDHFVVIAVDESVHAASGCSIDGVFRAMKEAEQLTGLNFFDRQMIALFENERLLFIAQKELKQKFLEGIWTNTSLTFNNLIQKKSELETNWRVPVSQSWLKRYITAETVS